MHHECKITVLEPKVFPELQEKRGGLKPQLCGDSSLLFVSTWEGLSSLWKILLMKYAWK